MNTIRARLLIMLLAGLAIVLTGGGLAVSWIADSKLTAQFDEKLESRAQSLASLVKLEPGGLVFEISDAPASVLEETAFELRTSSGATLKRSAHLGESGLPRRDLPEHETFITDTSLPGGERGRAIWLAFRPRVDPDDWEGLDITQAQPDVLIVAAAMERHSLDRALAALRGALLAAGGIVAVTAGLLVAMGVRWGLSPLDRMRNQLGEIGERTMSLRLDPSGAPREFLPMYRDINAMLDRVESTIERERTFASAAAHELRTPLAELRAVAEVALRWPEQHQAEAALREAKSIGQEMEHLVNSLLLISRRDVRPGPVAGDHVPMTCIVDDCIRRLNGSIQERQLQLSIDIGNEAPGGSGGFASGEAMQIIVRNLIDNAVYYTPARGSIAIKNGASDNGAGRESILVVENGPVALTQHELPRLFEPFWQLEKSRSDRRHVGLGLTVVKRFAEAVGLDIAAELAGDRLRMTISRRC